jgi:hypothetical protein
MNENKQVAVTAETRGVRVVRFTRPDLREHVDGNAEDTVLFRALRNKVLGGLMEGQTLVLNLGLIELFPTALYNCLLKIRAFVLARKARLILCRLSPEHEEIFDLFRAARLFDVARTEAQAVREATMGSGNVEEFEPSFTRSSSTARLRYTHPRRRTTFRW